MAYLERLKGMNIAEYFSIARKAVTKWVVGAHTSEELLGAHGTPPMQFVTSLLDLDTLVGCIGANWVDFMFKYGGTSAIQDIGSGGKGRNLQRYEGFNFSDFLTQAFSSGLFRDPLDRMIYAQTSKLHWCRFDKQASCAVNCEVELFDDGVVLKVAKPIMECARLNSIDIKKEVLKIKDKHRREFPKKYAPFLHDLKKFCTIFSGDHECVRSVKEITIRALDGLVANFPKSFVDDNLAIDLIEAYIWNHLNPVEWNYLYYGTEIVAASPYSSGICIGTTNVIPDDALQYIAALLDIFFGAVYYILHAMDLRKQQTKSAIGSIMSRNGSHNIGSHVLAALSHNVGTMPDDQVLYQYIQHRMDYIATATSERPSWCQPTQFVGDMMRRFLSQRHLLNYICRSEDLRAWEFQSDKAKKNPDGGKIKFHVRKVDSEGKCICDFIKYEEENRSKGKNFKEETEENAIESKEGENESATTIELKEDVSLAIPGGVVGQHAFFTIIENIVRNAAKHDWTTPPKSTAVLKDPGQTDSNLKGNLDVYIDFEDKPEDENVHFTIWTRLSDVFENVVPTDARKKEATEADLKQWKTLGDLSTLPLHHRQHVKLVNSFIDDSGGLRRENWGLAEMKISAGYLQKASIDDIGGISGSFGYDIIRPCCVADKEAGARLELRESGQHASRDEKKKIKEYNARIKALDDVCHLGYRFDVPKAKKMLFVVSEMTEKLKTQEIPLRQKGIYIKSFGAVKDLQESKTLMEKGLAYQYVILDEFSEAQKKWLLPFRVLVAKDALPELSSLVPRLAIKRDSEERNFNSTLEYLKFIIDETCATTGDKDLYDAITNDICACWARHLIKQKRIKVENGRGYIKEGLGTSAVSLVVSTLGGDSGAGKSLASVEDVVEFALNEGLDTALATYKATCKPVKESINDKIITRLNALKVQGDLVYTRTNDLKKERKGLIEQQLAAWLEVTVNGNGENEEENDIEIKSAIDYLTGAAVDVQELDKQLKEIDEKYQATEGNEHEYWGRKYDEVEEKKEKAIASCQNKESIDHLVKYIDSYCDQIKNLLSKYAEKIATLPEGFSVKGNNQWKNGWNDAGILPYQNNSDKILNLRYWRHQTNKDDKYDYYLEPLSGTQSYLSTLDAIKGNEYTLLSNLVENALFRILIIDERTREFLEKHIAQKQTFRNMGIYVANDGKVAKDMEARANGAKIDTNIPEFSAEGFVNIDANTVCEVGKWYAPGGEVDEKKVNKKKRRELIDKAKKRFHDKYDALIIHQGIIDKWLPGAAHSQEKVEKFIEGLKQVFKYVVITTGRGTPANIPDSARVLPFSTIQTTLFKQYPEKMILTDAIMNILPVRAGNGRN